MNRVTLIGKLGADPELKVLNGGKSVCNFRVACSEKYKDASGADKEVTEWVNCVLWGKSGEYLAKNAQKGSKVFIEGSLKTETYEKNGEKRYATKVNARFVEVIASGKRSDSPAGRAATPDTGDFGGADDDDSMPF